MLSKGNKKYMIVRLPAEDATAHFQKRADSIDAQISGLRKIIDIVLKHNCQNIAVANKHYQEIRSGILHIISVEKNTPQKEIRHRIHVLTAAFLLAEMILTAEFKNHPDQVKNIIDHVKNIIDLTEDTEAAFHILYQLLGWYCFNQSKLSMPSIILIYDVFQNMEKNLVRQIYSSTDHRLHLRPIIIVANMYDILLYLEHLPINNVYILFRALKFCNDVCHNINELILREDIAKLYQQIESYRILYFKSALTEKNRENKMYRGLQQVNDDLAGVGIRCVNALVTRKTASLVENLNDLLKIMSPMKELLRETTTDFSGLEIKYLDLLNHYQFHFVNYIILLEYAADVDKKNISLADCIETVIANKNLFYLTPNETSDQPTYYITPQFSTMLHAIVILFEIRPELFAKETQHTIFDTYVNLFNEFILILNTLENNVISVANMLYLKSLANILTRLLSWEAIPYDKRMSATKAFYDVKQKHNNPGFKSDEFTIIMRFRSLDIEIDDLAKGIEQTNTDKPANTKNGTKPKNGHKPSKPKKTKTSNSAKPKKPVKVQEPQTNHSCHSDAMLNETEQQVDSTEVPQPTSANDNTLPTAEQLEEESRTRRLALAALDLSVNITDSERLIFQTANAKLSIYTDKFSNKITLFSIKNTFYNGTTIDSLVESPGVEINSGMSVKNRS